MNFIENIKDQLQSINEVVNYIYKFSKDSNTHFFFLYPETLRFSDKIDEIYYSSIDSILDEGLGIDLCFTFDRDEFFSFDDPDATYDSTQSKVVEGVHDERSVKSDIEISRKEMTVFADERLHQHSDSNTWLIKGKDHCKIVKGPQTADRTKGQYVYNGVEHDDFFEDFIEVKENKGRNNCLPMAA